MRYTNNQSVSNLMTSIKLCDIAANVRAKRERRKESRPGELLAAERGETPWPHAVFSVYWPLARPDSFAPRGTVTTTRAAVDVALA